jgi:hypothetical protein
VIARYGTPNPLGIRRSEDNEVYEYRFNEARALYLRLIPTLPRDELFTFSKLMNILELRRVRLMSRTFNSGQFYRNKYGALSYETSGTNLMPVAMTQLHRNGEIWAVTREFWVHHAGEEVVAMGNVKNRLTECLENSVQVAGAELGIEPPYEIEVGVVGLQNMRLSRPQERMTGYVEQFSDVVHDDGVYVRKVVHDPTPSAQGAIVRQLLGDVWALAGIDLE